jgi:hypothetical protein
LQEDREIWRELAEDLEQRANEMGSVEVLNWLENTASHSLRIGPRQTIRISGVEATLERLCRQHIRMPESSPQAPLRTERLAQSHDPSGGTERSQGRGRSICSSFNTRLAVASVAATLTVAASLSFRSSHSITTWVSKPELNSSQTRIDDPIVSLLYSPKMYEAYFLNVELESQILPARRHARKRASVLQHRRSHLKSDNLALRPLRVPGPHMPAPPPHIEVVAHAIVSLPSSSLPEAPKFRGRHGRFVHVLAVIAAPLRLLASR